MAEDKQHSEAVKNTVAIEQSGSCKKKIVVEIPEETVKKATDEQYETLRREVILPGFRKGRAPRRLLEKRLGKETTEQIKLKLLSDASDAAIKDNKLDILGEPDIDFEKIEMPAAGPLKFDFEVEVRPEFELPALEGIAVKRVKQEVKDKQIKGEIEQLQKWAGMWVPRQDGAVEADDQVIADAILKIEGVEEEQRNDNVEIYVRQSGVIGAVPVTKLDEFLKGAKIGDVRQTSVDVPKTYIRTEYRGKKIDVKITVKEIKYLKPAEMNEGFFKRFGASTEDELRERVRDMLRGRFEQMARENMTGQIYKYMLDNTNFDLPLDVVADQSDVVLHRRYANLMMHGFTREQIEEQLEELKTSSEQQAKEQLKAFFIMDKVAEKLGIEVTDEEINGRIAQLAIERNQRPERLKDEMSRDGSLGQFRLQVREEKCIAKLLESAKITEVEPEEEAAKEKQAAVKSAKKKEEKPKEEPAKEKQVVSKSAKKKEEPEKKKPKDKSATHTADKKEQAEKRKTTPKKKKSSD
jgi:trigger factor